MMAIRRVVDETDEWMRALIRTTPATIQWDRVALTSVGIAAPVGLSLLLAPHDDAAIGAGSLASMGALVASAMDRGAAGMERVHRMSVGSAMALLGFALGTVVYGHAVWTFIAVIGAALLSGLSGAVSATASRAAVYFLMFAVMAANTDFALASPWVAPLIFTAGAAWRLLLTAVAAAFEGRAFAPERRVVSRVYSALADQLASTGSARREAGVAVTAALNDAYDVLVAARTDISVHDHRWQTLVAMLNASAPVVDAAIAAAQFADAGVDAGADAGMDADAVSIAPYLRGVAAWVRDPSLPPPALPATGAASPLAATLASSLAHVARVVATVVRTGSAATAAQSMPLPRPLSVRGRLRAAGRALTTGTELWNSILRLVLCMAVAQAVCLGWHLERPYLVMLTVAQVMKPDFGSVFGRAVQRGGGVVIGVAIGSLAVAVVPRGPWQILVIVLLAASIPIVMPRNYGLYSIVTTPLAVLLVELHVSNSANLVDVRMFDTLLGCAIVLMLGYLPWPQTWHAPRYLAADVAALVRSLGTYADAALRHPDGGDRAELRRGIYRRISDLRTTIGQSMAEPPVISAANASWLPEIAALERVADAVTAEATEAAASGVTFDARAIDSVVSSLDAFAQAVDSRSVPAEIDVPPGALDAVRGELVAARAALVSRAKLVAQPARRVRSEAS